MERLYTQTTVRANTGCVPFAQTNLNTQKGKLDPPTHGHPHPHQHLHIHTYTRTCRNLLKHSVTTFRNKQGVQTMRNLRGKGGAIRSEPFIA